MKIFLMAEDYYIRSGGWQIVASHVDKQEHLNSCNSQMLDE